MPVTLSIKNVPDEIASRLRHRAAQHHRSLQGELMAILETSMNGEHPLSPQDVLREIRRSGLRTRREATAMIRRERDARSR